MGMPISEGNSLPVVDKDDRRALVLGGGGLVGIAWEIGVLAGLVDCGVAVDQSDLVVGTSAGATVAAQLTSSVDIADFYKQQLDPSAGMEQSVDVDVAALFDEMGEVLENNPPLVARRMLGAMAVERDRVPEAERRAIIAARLQDHDWPSTTLKITAIDAETGELAIFDNASGVELVDAVAASAAIPVVWPAVTINGRRYYDGGGRSETNLDIAMDYGRVLIVQPMTSFEAADVAPLGPNSQSIVIHPDDDSLTAFGDDALDPTARPACAEAGYAQGKRLAEQVNSFWA